MNKKQLEKNYKKKLNLIKKYNQYYFDKSEPIVSDQVYDDLKKDLNNR